MTTVEKQQHIFGMIFLFANRIQTISDREGKDITLKQWFVLAVISKLEDQSPTINMVGDFMGYTRQNAKKILTLLEQKGYVQLLVSPQDKRAKQVVLTKKAQAYFNETEAFGNQLIDDLFKGFDDKEVNRVFESFIKLEQNIQYLDEKNRKK